MWTLGHALLFLLLSIPISGYIMYLFIEADNKREDERDK